jgi:stage II sporulation protein D
MSFLKKETHFYIEEKPVTIRLKLKDDSIVSLDLEDYIIGVVSAEMPALYEEESLKAQAIASRSFAMYKIKHSKNNYDVLTTTKDQAYQTNDELKTKWQNKYDEYYAKIKEAVSATKDLVMTYQNDVICAYYFSISNGYTEDAKTVFNSDLDYLKSTTSPDTNVKNYELTIKYTKQEFCKKLNITCDVIDIKNIIRNNTNHVSKITINNQDFTGVEIRKKLNLRSTDFIIENNQDIYITTKGYGHGVGMSQAGANELAKKGYSYDEILHYYYQNIEIQKLNV